MKIIQAATRAADRRIKKGMLAGAIAGVLAVAGLLAVAGSANATGSSSPAARAAITPATTPEIEINYFYSEVAVPVSAAWEWLSGPVFGRPTEFFANTTSRAIVTGSASFGSSNGRAVSGHLGVCYQPAAGGPVMFGNWELIDFTAPRGQWVTQEISGTILPGPNGFAPGYYTVGLCIQDQSANLVYNTYAGSSTGDVIVAPDATS